MTDAETIGRYMSVKKYKEVASLLINVLKDKESIDIQQAFSNAINFSPLCKGAIEGVFTWASRIALEEGKLLVVYPETSCQGLFNQIHKKATKKVPGSRF